MLRHFWSSKGGNFAAIFAVALIPVMASVVGLVDFVSTSNKASKLQNALDTAALAIATEYYSGMTQAQLEDLGETYFGSNMDSGMTAEGEYFTFADETDSFEISAADEGRLNFISVSSRITHDGLLGGVSGWHATRHSFVRISPGQPACVLALDKTASDAVKIQGSTQVVLDGCVISANSKAPDAVLRAGTALLTADCVSVVGGTEGLATSQTNLDCSKALENQRPASDPLANVQVPSASCPGGESVPGGQTKVLQPGVYCNKTWSGNITLTPGVYVLKGGKVQLGGNGSLEGTGVTIFLLDGAEFTTNGNETLKLFPPQSGPYAGITIFQAPGNTNTLKINGTSDSIVEGFIYAPSAHIIYTGNAIATATPECIRIIGNTIELNGNSSTAANCVGKLGGREIYASREIRLVR